MVRLRFIGLAMYKNEHEKTGWLLVNQSAMYNYSTYSLIS